MPSLPDRVAKAQSKAGARMTQAISWVYPRFPRGKMDASICVLSDSTACSFYLPETPPEPDVLRWYAKQGNYFEGLHVCCMHSGKAIT